MEVEISRICTIKKEDLSVVAEGNTLACGSDGQDFVTWSKYGVEKGPVCGS